LTQRAIVVMNSTSTLATPGLIAAKPRRPAQKGRPRLRETPAIMTARTAGPGNGAGEAGVTVDSGESPPIPLGVRRPELAGAPAGKNETVLVVDSVPLMRGGISEVLRRLGYRVLEASCALEVQAITNTEKNIRLLILDLSSLEISDLEFVAWFRLSYPAIKVVVAAGSIW